MKKITSLAACIMLAAVLSAFALPFGKGSKPVSPVTPEGYKLIVSSKDKGVYVYGKVMDNLPYFNQVLVKTPDGEKTFNWKASERDPILIVQDISESGKEHVIIVFVTAFGTGAYESQVHVLDKSLGEIPVDNPVDVVRAYVKASIIGDNVVFRASNKEFVVKPAAGIPSPEEALRNLQYGSQVSFSVKDNKLVSGVSAQISPNSILGQFVLEYTYENNRFIPKIVDFQSY